MISKPSLSPSLHMTVMFTVLEGTAGGFGPGIFSMISEILEPDQESDQTIPSEVKEAAA